LLSRTLFLPSAKFSLHAATAGALFGLSSHLISWESRLLSLNWDWNSMQPRAILNGLLKQCLRSKESNGGTERGEIDGKPEIRRFGSSHHRPCPCRRCFSTPCDGRKTVTSALRSTLREAVRRFTTAVYSDRFNFSRTAAFDCRLFVYWSLPSGLCGPTIMIDALNNNAQVSSIS
uniref:Secreted protein n=1 Tax=Soboliphyme baturini TaxID=241478 RepID=A0A183IMK3_9BILA